jgi:LacI family transcriptional regulator, galactose operon repressor
MRRIKPKPRSRSGRTAATIHDVAARAGVSVATVSRVLNRKKVVREETAQQVLAAAKALRYVPNVAARSLSSRRSQTLGIVLPELHGEFFSELIRGVDLAARRAGYHILVSGSHSDAGEMLSVLAAMRGRVDGLVVMAPDVAPAALGATLPSGLPAVLLDAVVPGHDSITIDNYGGAQEMMRHLDGLGHKRIAFIKGPRQNADARERLRGYREAMRRQGGGAPRELELPGDFTEDSGRSAALAVLAARPRPTAIFAANDAMAVGALVALAGAGVAVPEEMSVAGFDDIPIARFVAPPLTTIQIDIADFGRRACALLLAAIERPRAGAERREHVATTLVVRASCRSLENHTMPGTRSEGKPRGRAKGEDS